MSKAKIANRKQQNKQADTSNITSEMAGELEMLAMTVPAEPHNGTNGRVNGEVLAKRISHLYNANSKREKDGQQLSKSQAKEIIGILREVLVQAMKDDEFVSIQKFFMLEMVDVLGRKIGDVTIPPRRRPRVRLSENVKKETRKDLA